MDFMDPAWRLRHNIMVIVGYVLIAVALSLATVILVFMAYGFGYRNGQVVLNGLLFLSSGPKSAQVYINGARYKSNTNTKLTLPAGTYNFVLKRAGYRDWQRPITITGGDVESYVYPVLFPASLTTNTKQDYTGAPSLAAESLDKRWLVIGRPGSLTEFDSYDLHNPSRQPSLLALPEGVLTASTDPQALDAVAWASDNTHLLLKHTFGAQTEYILLNRNAPEQSVNLTKVLSLPTSNTDLRLSNGRYDRYLELNTATHTLARATLSAPQAVTYLTNVLSFTTSGDATVIYVTPDPANAKQVDIDVYDGSATYTIRHDAAGTAYPLDAATYQGSLYIAVGITGENVGFIYRDPVGQLTNQRLGVAVPVRVFHITSPDYVSFSPGGQYALFEHGTSLASYDLGNLQGSLYSLPDAIDAGQAHLSWIDGARLTYVSKGQIIVLDYDGGNRQALVSGDPRYAASFDGSSKFLYALVPAASEKDHELLTSTSLLTPADR